MTQPIRTPQRLPDSEARDAEAGRDPAVRERARPRRRQGARRAAAGRGPQVPGAVRGQAIIEWKNDELKKMYEKQVASRARAGGVRADANDARSSSHRVVRHLDALAPRAGRARTARAEGLRGVSADDPAVEPLEGSQEEDRLAAVSRLLLRALRRARAAPDPQVHRASSTSSRSTATSPRSPTSRSTASGGWSRAICSTIPAR